MTSQNRARVYSGGVLIGGSAMLIAWVLFRFSTKAVNFDLVGQQLLSRQWLGGNVEGTTIGPTNYILKMLFLYMPGELLGIDPKVFLITSTIIVNIITFIGMYVVLRRIVNYFFVETGNMFNIAMLWLVAVAGSVFWVQFTNSRNIELLAGLLLLYVGLLLYRKVSFLYGVFFLVLAGLTFFSDPLQLFVTSSVLVLYVFMNSFLFEKEKRREPFIILLLVIGGCVLSRLCVIVVQNVAGVEFIRMDTLSQSLAVVHSIPVVILETAKNIARLVAGTNEMGVWRQVVNLLLISFLSVLALFSLMKNKVYVKHQSLTLFTALMLVVPIAVYMASGQALFQGDTSRYLIVLAPALIILFSLADIKNVSAYAKKGVVIAVLPLLIANVGSLFYVAFQTGAEDVLHTTHLEQRYAYLDQKSYGYGYASMDTAIPSMYLLGKSSNRVLLPLSCEGTVLRKSTLFFDKNVFTQSEKQEGAVPIILDGNAISNYPNNCTVESIQTQLGGPLAIDKSGDNVVLLYDSHRLKGLRF